MYIISKGQHFSVMEKFNTFIHPILLRVIQNKDMQLNTGSASISTPYGFKGNEVLAPNLLLLVHGFY